jgi:hypothetical protein
MDPMGRFALICKVLWTLLHGCFNVYVLILCVIQVIYRDDSLLSLNDQMEWFR